MFEKFFSKFGSETVAQEEKFFSEIEGYGDLKKLISKMVVSKESANVILDGPPASGKTIFLFFNSEKYERYIFHRCNKCVRSRNN